MGGLRGRVWELRYRGWTRTVKRGRYREGLRPVALLLWPARRQEARRLCTRLRLRGDVVVIRREAGRRHKPDPLVEAELEMLERGLLVVAQRRNHAGVSEHLNIEMGGCRQVALELSENLGDDRHGGLHHAGATAGRAGLTEHLLQALAVPLAGHLDQTKLADLRNLHPAPVVGERLVERSEYGLPVRGCDMSMKSMMTRPPMFRRQSW